MDADSSEPLPKRLKTLCSEVQYHRGNTLIHQFVLNQSYPNRTGSAGLLNAVLISFPSKSINLHNRKGYTALHLAAMKGNALMVKKLLTCPVFDVDVNALSANYDQNSALHLAAKFGHFSTVVELLNHGADVNVRNADDDTPLHSVATAGRFSTYEDLLNYGFPVKRKHPADESTTLDLSKSMPHLNIFLELLKNGADVNSKNEDGNTPLHMLIICDYETLIQPLLNNGADVNIKNEQGNTALHIAILKGNVIHYKRLLERMDDQNAALCLAIVRRFYFITDILLKSGADVTIKNEKLETVLHLSAVGGCNNIIRKILCKGNVVNMRDRHGNTALHVAAFRNNYVAVGHLLYYGANPNMKNLFQNTAWDIAVRYGYSHVIQALANGKAASHQWTFSRYIKEPE